MSGTKQSSPAQAAWLMCKNHKGSCLAHLRPNLGFGLSFGQIFATMCVITSGFSKSLKDLTLTTFSCQRRVAHFLIFLSGAYFVTGTHTRRADFRIIFDANSVFLKLGGLPSVKTMTFD